MPGYDTLADFMSSRPDTSILRRFSQLNVESLLHMQAELLGLEMTVEEIRANPDLNGLNTSWLAAPQCDANAAIAGVFERIRVLLDTYRRELIEVHIRTADERTDSTILRTAQINALETPPKDSFDLLQRWYDSDEEKGGQTFLQGIEAAVFRDSSVQDDLLSINPRPGKHDPIAMFIADHVVPVYDRCIGHRLAIHQAKGVQAIAHAREYHMKALVMLGNLICMLISAIMPALAILILFNVKSTLSRLMAVVVLSLAFSVVMTVIASRKADVFMATTAFAAVLVVFVGSTD